MWECSSDSWSVTSVSAGRLSARDCCISRISAPRLDWPLASVYITNTLTLPGWGLSSQHSELQWDQCSEYSAVTTWSSFSSDVMQAPVFPDANASLDIPVSQSPKLEASHWFFMLILSSCQLWSFCSSNRPSILLFIIRSLPNCTPTLRDLIGVSQLDY